MTDEDYGGDYARLYAPCDCCDPPEEGGPPAHLEQDPDELEGSACD